MLKGLDLSVFQTVGQVQTPDDFDALVQRIEAISARRPAYYRRQLRWLALLGYGYVAVVFLALLGGVLAIRYGLTFTGLGALASQFDIILLLLLLGAGRLFIVRIPAPTGVPLGRSQVPALFTMLDDLTQRMQAPRFHHVLLTDELNAAIIQRPQFGIMGWSRHYLIIGLPLLVTLSPEQFRAVLAHEIAHLAGDDSQFAGWIYRIRRMWFDLAEQFERDRQGGLLFRRFFQWYGPFFRAYSFVLARSQEYQADQRAAAIAGADTKAAALLRLYINGHALQETIEPELYQLSNLEEDPPHDRVTQLVQKLQAPRSPDQAAIALRLALAQPSTNADTHPSLRDRLAALDYAVDVQSLPSPPQPTAAAAFLGSQLEDFTRQLDQLWYQQHAPRWHERQARRQLSSQRLHELNQAASQRSLTIAETWKQAALTRLHVDPAAAIARYETLLQRSPHHGRGNLELGELLLNQHDDRGLVHLERAIAADPSLTLLACEAALTYYHHHPDPTAIAQWADRMQAQRSWLNTVKERTELSPFDTFQPHDLPPAEVAQLAATLAAEPTLKTALLVRKVLPSHPQVNWYVLAVVRQIPIGGGSTYDRDDTFSDRLQRRLCFAEHLQILVLQKSTRSLWQVMTRIPGARIVG